MASGAGTFSLDDYEGEAKAWVAAAQQLADELKHAEVEPLHLLARGLERDVGVIAVFDKSKVGATRALQEARAALGKLAQSNEPSYLSARLLTLLQRAQRAARGESQAVGVRHLLDALTREVRGPAADVLAALDIGPGDLGPHLAALRSSALLNAAANDWVIDLIAAARGGAADPVIGRGEEIRRVLTILERRDKCHPLLVGEAGVGKRAIVRGLAAKIAKGDVPTSLVAVRLLELDVGALTSGTRLRSESEARLKKTIDAARSDAPTVLVIPSVTRVLGSGPASPGLGDMLQSALARGVIRVLATTEPEGLTKIAHQEPGLFRFFTTMSIEEPHAEQATQIVRGLAGSYERHHRVRISESAIVAAVQLAKRYVPDRFLPESAIGLLDETASARRVETDGITEDLDDARTELVSLKAQHASLDGAGDELSVKKRDELGARIERLAPEVEARSTELATRRGAVAAVRQLGSELLAAQRDLERAKEAKDYARIGELEHSTLVQLSERLERAEKDARESGLDASGALVEESHVARKLAEWTHIPVAKMLEGEADKLLKMEERLSQRVIGQPDAVAAIAAAVRRGRVGLRDPKRPIGSFLFLGSSGVGKTELAKALAEFLFDDEHALTRLDMSEFMERHMAQRLLGAPPGYADSDQGGFLTEAVRKRPYSVLLFDEVEKAHQDVFNLLLQVLDDGRLTDGRGRLADFTNTVVIMTSNIGSERIMEAQPAVFESADGREALRDVLLERLGEFFRPEFLNRIGDTVVFRPLSKADLSKIVDIQLARLGSLLAARSLTLSVEDDAKARLVDLGYEPALGARPLQRVIVRQLQDPLAERLLRGGFAEGQRVTVRLDGDGFRFDLE